MKKRTDFEFSEIKRHLVLDRRCYAHGIIGVRPPRLRLCFGRRYPYGIGKNHFQARRSQRKHRSI